LRNTNILPGSAPKIMLGSTRLSEQVITMVLGDWPKFASRSNVVRHSGHCSRRKRR
jgi:hypothetical protein